jgi:hypothetical protein
MCLARLSRGAAVAGASVSEDSHSFNVSATGLYGAQCRASELI